MALCRVQAVFQGRTLLPEDRFINTFHFSVIGPGTPEWRAACAEGVEAFYNQTLNAVTMAEFLSPFIRRQWETRSYDLDLPEGEREPTIQPWTLAAGPTVGYPEEVAICVTLEGAPPVTPRRRGRIYIGPLANIPSVYDHENNALPVRPDFVGAASVGQQLVSRAFALAADDTLGWSIRSITPSENFVRIEGGYVDNAFDTQRRRGPDPSARVTF